MTSDAGIRINMRRTPLPPAFVAALPRLEAELSIALSESAELPADQRLAHMPRDETPPTDTTNGPVPVIEDAQLKRIKIAFEDAVEAAIDMPGNVRANVGRLPLRARPQACAEHTPKWRWHNAAAEPHAAVLTMPAPAPAPAPAEPSVLTIAARSGERPQGRSAPHGPRRHARRRSRLRRHQAHPRRLYEA